ncbi:MAG TPA: hypothetical protein VMW16_06605 [Sedimentisphaerales bacterium]|nr:hypothetical protein [Sedimentisphaerales bacterium]
MYISDEVNSGGSTQRKTGKKILKLLGAVAVLALCLFLAFVLMIRTLRQTAVRRIAELTDAKVKAGSVDVTLAGSVFIEKLRISPRRETRDNDLILTAEKVYARFGIGSLLLLRPRLKKIRVKNFVLDVRYDLDTGRWNINALKIKVPKTGAGKMPRIHLEKGILKYSKVSKGLVKVTAQVPVEARFDPAEKTQDGCCFEITTAEVAGGPAKSSLTGCWRHGNLTIAGGISSTNIPGLERVCTINVLAAELNYDAGGSYSLDLRIKDLLGLNRTAADAYVTEAPELLKKFAAFAALQKFFGRYNPEGRIDIQFKASGNLYQLPDSQLCGSIYCKNVSICDRAFPYPVEHIVGRIDFTEKSAILHSLRGRHGDVTLAFNGWSRDFGPKWQYEIELASANMALNKDLYDALTPEQKKFWSVFSPSGPAAIDYRFSRRSPTDKQRSLVVELVGAEAAYRDFPYPLKNLSGKLLFDRDNITFSDVVSQFDGRRIVINGTVTGGDSVRPICKFLINAENVPLDSTLAAALSDRQRNLYNRLNVTGLADAEIKVLTPEADSGPPSFTAAVSLRETSLKLNNFPLAISNVSAKAVVTPDSVYVENLTGSNDGSTLSMTGRIWLAGEAEELCYHLALHAEHAQLNNELFGLLPDSLNAVVGSLEPKGKINYIADLNKAVGADAVDYTIKVDCLGNSFNVEHFPCPLENITGSLKIVAENVGPESSTSAGSGRTPPDAAAVTVSGRLAQKDEHNRSRLELDLENVKILGSDKGGKSINFSTAARFRDFNSIAPAALIELNAVLKMDGSYETGTGFRTGRATLSADSMRIKGVSLTGLNANIFYDPGRRSWLTENFVADCCGGKLTGKLEFKPNTNQAPDDYLLQIGFDNIDLEEFLKDWDKYDQAEHPIRFTVLSGTEAKQPSNNTYTSGKLEGSLSVAGQIAPVPEHDNTPRDDQADNHLPTGRCWLTISNMRVGRLSPLGKLLCVLKLTEPRDFAFDRMLVDSYIKQNKVCIEHLDLSGGAIAFNGSGWMDLQNRNIDLTLFARGSRLAAAEPSVFQSLTEGVGHAFVQIELTGSFYDPKVVVKTLPVIRDTLGILGTKRPRPKN